MPESSDSTVESLNDESVSPVTMSVILSRLAGVADEMSVTLESSSSGTIIALARDFSCAVFDATPKQVVSFDGLPAHTASLHVVMEGIHRAFGDDIAPGDVFMCNSTYHGNTHIGDLVVTQPVFHEGRHVFWATTKAHQLDVGAVEAASIVPSAPDIWSEGMQIPPLRIVDAGRVRHDVVDMYLANMRFRDQVRGDLFAGIGAAGKGNQRLLELIDDYGIDSLLRYTRAILDYSRRRMEVELQSIPDGVYHGESWVDTDAIAAHNLPIKAEVRVSGSHVEIDYTGSHPQVPSGVNGSEATSRGAGVIPFLVYAANDIPYNAGCIDSISSTVPSGSLCLAEHPGSTSAATVTPSDAMVDAVNRAMAHAVPDKVFAGGSRASNLPIVTGIDPTTGSLWGIVIFNGAGGAGAANGADGWPIYVTPAAMAGQRTYSIEQMEMLNPIRVLEMEIEPDSMGMGEYIGGPGVRLSVTASDATEFNVLTFGDGADNPPHGVVGGTAGIGGGQFVQLPDGSRTFYSAVAAYTVPPGAVRTGVSSGGGGYGSPLDRPIDRVLRDVRDGLISQGAAEEIFGVHCEGEPLEVSEERTRAARAELSRVLPPLLTPDLAGAARWHESQMQEADQYIFNAKLEKA